VEWFWDGLPRRLLAPISVRVRDARLLTPEQGCSTKAIEGSIFMLKEFFRGKSFARLLAIAALGLLLLSQFFYYFDDGNTGILTFGPDFSSSRLHLWFGSIGTGWDLHPHAYIILLVLAFALLRDDIADTPLFDRFGYWAMLILFFAATTPGAPFRATGAGLGAIATLMALAAAALNKRDRKKRLVAAADEMVQKPQ
jgi:hypothetical protein